MKEQRKEYLRSIYPLGAREWMTQKFEGKISSEELVFLTDKWMEKNKKKEVEQIANAFDGEIVD